MASKQFNVELPAELINRVKIDAIKTGVSASEWSRIAFEGFLGKPLTARRVNLEDAKKKIVGRKIKP